MKTMIDLPDELIEEAMHTLPLKTTTQVIILALQELVKKNKIAELKNFKGKVNLEIDIDTLRNRDVHPS